jgi:hypothetical protein
MKHHGKRVDLSGGLFQKLESQNGAAGRPAGGAEKFGKTVAGRPHALDGGVFSESIGASGGVSQFG